MNKAVRGRIFHFLEKDGTSNKSCLVISSDSRKTDKIVSILMLGTRDSSDAIEVMDGFYVHCGLITYCDRKRLGDPITDIDGNTLYTIEEGINHALGLNKVDYETMYNDLLDRVTKNAQEGTDNVHE